MRHAQRATDPLLESSEAHRLSSQSGARLRSFSNRGVMPNQHSMREWTRRVRLDKHQKSVVHVMDGQSLTDERTLSERSGTTTDKLLTYAYSMSDATALSFNQLPLEILHGIFRYFDIPDILRICRVSDTFLAIQFGVLRFEQNNWVHRSLDI